MDPDPFGSAFQYYNCANLETSRSAAKGWGGPPPALPPPPAPPTAPGWYYRDLQNSSQGPFSLSQLAGWRGSLPMELRVWCVSAPASAASTEPLEERPLASVLGDTELLQLLRGGQLTGLPPNASGEAAEAALWRAAEAAEAAEAAATAAAAAAAARCEGLYGEEEGGGMSAAVLVEASLAGWPAEARAEALSGAAARAPA